MATNDKETQALSAYLQPVASGKVRELYAVDESTLLFVATDRISAYDVVLSTPIPDKGRVLTLMSEHWFGVLSAAVPGLQHHFLTRSLPASIPSSSAPTELKDYLRDRSMQVRRLRVLPIEAIVRGYITGSAWAEYRASGTVNGTPAPTGLRESEAFPTPLYTPSTKAEGGAHDENISVARAAEIIEAFSEQQKQQDVSLGFDGARVARRVEELAVQLYTVARDAARARGIIIADTKFEFGVDAGGEVVLIDEVLTPDSSRFWPGGDDDGQYAVGRSQQSFDKQALRDWLTAEKLRGKQGVQLPDHVVKETADRYRQAYEIITGKKFTSSS